MNLYCNDLDLYSVTTSSYYIVFGLLGASTGKMFLLDIYSYMIVTGIISYIQYSGLLRFENYQLYQYPLMITSTLVVNRLISECIKYYISKKKKKNNYYLPCILLNMIILLSFSFGIIYSNIYFILGCIFCVQLLASIMAITFFSKGTAHYSDIRSMVIKMLIANFIGCLGLSTAPYCLYFRQFSWFYLVQIFIGIPTANTFLSYSLYMACQCTLLIRGINLNRKIIIKGNNNIYIVMYLGRN